MPVTPLQSLAEYGQSAWLDATASAPIDPDGLGRLVRDHGITGVVAGVETGVDDVRRACDLVSAIWRSRGGRDGHVSAALPPGRGRGLLERATLLHARVGRPNLLVRIAPTAPGLAAAEHLVAAGVSVDISPVFDAATHLDAARAYLRGLERLLDDGGDPAAVTSVAGIALAPLDEEVDRRLPRSSGRGSALRGRFAIATARLAHLQALQAFSGRRWSALQACGAVAQRCLWRSTAPLDPAYPDVFYVEELIGACTVASLSPATIDAFEDHGVVADRLGRGLNGARRVMAGVRAAGVDLEDVACTLQAADAEVRRTAPPS